MRRYPIPLILAALVATAAVTVVLKISVAAVPIYAEPNFTTVVPAGSYVVWKGAANQFTVSANASGTVYVVHGPFAALYAPNGLPVNVTLGDNRYIVGDNNTVAYLVNIGGSEYGAFILKPATGYSGFYVTDAVPNSVCQKIYDIAYQKFGVTTLCYMGQYIANSTGFYVTYVGPGGVYKTVKYSYGLSFNMGRDGVTVYGVAGGANVAGYPVAWRYVTVFVISPNDNAEVVIYVK